jgi:hypothetical protein
VTCRGGLLNIVCSIVFASSSSTLRSVGTRVSRDGVTYAYGTRSTKSKRSSISLTRKRRLTAGRYRLTITVRDAAGRVLSTKHSTLLIAKAKSKK